MSDCLTVTEAIDMFLVACQADGLRRATVQTYVDKLKPLRHVFGEFPLESITTPNLRRFFADLQKQQKRWKDHPYIPPQEGGYSPETIHGFFRAVRRFFNWCVEDSLLEDSPVNGIRQKRNKNRIPKGISLDTFEALLKMTEGETVGTTVIGRYCCSWAIQDAGQGALSI